MSDAPLPSPDLAARLREEASKARAFIVKQPVIEGWVRRTGRLLRTAAGDLTRLELELANMTVECLAQRKRAERAEAERDAARLFADGNASAMLKAKARAEAAEAEASRLRAALDRIASLHDPGNEEHRTVTLSKIIGWCRAVLSTPTPIAPEEER